MCASAIAYFIIRSCTRITPFKKRAAIFLQAFIVMFHFFGTKRIFSSNQNKEKKNSKKEDLKW